MRKKLTILSVLALLVMFFPFQAMGEQLEDFTILDQVLIERSIDTDEGPFGACPQLGYNVTACSDTPCNEPLINTISGGNCSCWQANVLVNTQGFGSAIELKGVWGFQIGTQWYIFKSELWTLQPDKCYWLMLRLSVPETFSCKYAGGAEYMGTVYHKIPTYGLYPLSVNCN